MKHMSRVAVFIGLLGATVVIGFSTSAAAMQFSSTDYIIDTGTLTNVGGWSSSTDYQLSSSGGEAAIGNGASGSYKLAGGYIAQINTPYISVNTQPVGITGEFPLDENSGTTTFDNSGNGSNGYFVGTPSWVSGKIGNALSFTGTQTVNLGNPPQDQVSNMTLEAWVKTSTAQPAGGAAVIGKNSAWALNLTSTGSALYDYGTSANTCTDTTPVANGSWHLLTATIQSGVVGGTTLYIDGVKKQTCTVTIQNQSSVISLAGVSGTAQYTGSIDLVKLFGRVLSSADVSAEYTAQSNGIPTGLSLQTITPGVSNSNSFNVITRTSGSGYVLAINEDHDLQSGSNTIPAISAGTIASPTAWSEGTTKGLGFTLTATNATAIPAGWNSGNSYAALPTTSTSFYTRSGTQSSSDTLTMQLRADVAPTQVMGQYSNTLTITGTANP